MSLSDKLEEGKTKVGKSVSTAADLRPVRSTLVAPGFFEP